MRKVISNVESRRDSSHPNLKGQNDINPASKAKTADARMIRSKKGDIFLFKMTSVSDNPLFWAN
jgi:hypothetical protein